MRSVLPLATKPCGCTAAPSLCVSAGLAWNRRPSPRLWQRQSGTCTKRGRAGPVRNGLGTLGGLHPARAGILAAAAAATVVPTASMATAAAAAAASSAPAAAETAALGALTEAGREVLLQVVLPLLFVWLLQQWLERLEERTLQEMHAAQAVNAEADAAVAAAEGAVPNTGVSDTAAAAARAAAAAASHRHARMPRRTSLMRRLFSGLPSAPSRLALIALTVTHVARSLAEINKRLAERGVAEGWLGSPTLASYVLGSGRGADVVEAMRTAMATLDHGLMTLYKMLLVGVCTWVVVSWKDVVLSRFLLRRSQHHAGEDLERILTPLNTVASWALVVCAVLLVVSMVGVDVRPLLVLTGGGGVVAGLASQQLLSNAVSGLQMYMDRPFRVGDTIAVNAGGGAVEGEVVDLSALRTHVLTSDGCIVAIPNRALSDMVITNKSQSSRGGVRPPWMETRTPLSVTLRIRLRPATYDRMWAKMDDLKTAIITTGAVEALGKSAPTLEVQSFTERGVMVQARVTLRNPYKGPAMASSLPAVSAVPAAPAATAASLPATATLPNTSTIVVSSNPAAAAVNVLGDADWVSFTTQDSPSSDPPMPAHTAASPSSSSNGTDAAAAGGTTSSAAAAAAVAAAGDTASSAAAAAAVAGAPNNGVHAPPPLHLYPPPAAPSNYFWPPSDANNTSSADSAAAIADSATAAASSSALAAAAPAAAVTAAAVPAAAAGGGVDSVGSSGGGGGPGDGSGGKSSQKSFASRRQQQGAAQPASPQQLQQEEGVSRETVRLMRQQLLLNLGPWIQAHNATLTVGD